MGIIVQHRLVGWTCTKCGAVEWWPRQPYSETKGNWKWHGVHDWKRVEMWAPQVKEET